MFETGDATIPLATAVQWVIAIGAGAGGVIGYVWTWTLKREARQQDRFDAIRQAAQEREREHATELRSELVARLEDHERWRRIVIKEQGGK